MTYIRCGWLKHERFQAPTNALSCVLPPACCLPQDGLEEAPLCLWVAGRLPQALAPFLELGGTATGPAVAAGGAPGVPLPLGGRSGAGGGGGGGPGVLRLTGAVRRDRLLRYELLRTVLATGLDGVSTVARRRGPGTD